MGPVQEAVQSCRTIIGPTFVEVDENLINESMEELRRQGCFVVQIDTKPVRDLDELLNAFYEKCHFPDYFVFNEAALKDCLVDFSWLPAAGYIFVFLNIHELKDETLRIFIEHFALAHLIKERKARVPLKLLLPQDDRNGRLRGISDTSEAEYAAFLTRKRQKQIARLKKADGVASQG